jgi:hypothetical protein
MGSRSFFVSAGVHTPAEMPRSGNKVMSKERRGLRISVLILIGKEQSGL